jgi:hypothetical protein
MKAKKKKTHKRKEVSFFWEIKKKKIGTKLPRKNRTF